MSIALYRRYRPDRFADLIGQDVAAHTLRNEVRSGALAHAYLFAGMRGTGKTSTARILARAVNCLAPEDGEPCNKCAACVEIASGASVDVLEIDAASNRGIDEMRDLRDKVKYLPASVRRKVYIIDEAHMLTTEAWNALLKTLEEPPDHVLFVLATTEPHKVLETVRSRVQRFDFRRVSTSDIAKHLTSVAEREGVDVDVDAVQLLARSGQGSVRDALSLLDQAISAGETPVTVATARRALGLTDPATLFELMRALAGADAAAALRSASRAFEAGADPRQLLREVSRLARGAELHGLGYPEGADLSAEEAALCADLAAVAPSGFWLSGLDLFAAADINLRQPVDARLLVELSLLRLLRPAASEGGDAAVASLTARVEALEQRARRAAPASAAPTQAPTSAPTPASAPAQPQASAPASSPAPASTTTADSVEPAAEPEVEISASPADPNAGAGAAAFTVDRWRAEWPLLIEAVTRGDTMLAGVLRDCHPVEAAPGRLVIGTDRSFHISQISDSGKAAVLSEAASSIAGEPVVVETRFTGQPREAAEPTAGEIGDVTQAVLQTFAGSRVTATRIRDEPG